MKEALFYQTLDNQSVMCNLCGHRCVITLDKLGVCDVRQNVEGKLFSLVYGAIISQQIDPIEKKPLFHFLPSSKAFSIATPGCNFSCQWCQNWQISNKPQQFTLPPNNMILPVDILNEALKSNCQSIAYTYTEPTIFYEFAYDTAILAKESNIANVFISNGYMTEEMLEHIHPYLDAINVDLKSFRKKTYQKFMGAGLQTVLDSLKKISALGIWLEITTLIIPEFNDSIEELSEIANFISSELGPNTPWHISRFFPNHRMRNVPTTAATTLSIAEEIGRDAGLNYVYQGNLHEETSNTRCPNCQKELIIRLGYQTDIKGIKDGKCIDCGEDIAGVWA